MSGKPKEDDAPDIVRGERSSPECHRCPLANDLGKPHRPVAGEGSPNPRWIALGEGPGNIEVMEGRPFVGPSGRMLQRVIKSVDADRHDLWLTNTTLCIPRNKTEAMIKQARECCAPRLQQELAKFPGVPVLTLGAVAAHAMLGEHFSLSELSGSLSESNIDGTGNRPVIATHHPARILRGGDGKSTSDRAVDLLFVNLLYDAAKVNALGLGNDIRFSDDVEIEASDPARGEALMADMLADARRLGACAIDVETDGLNARRVSLTAIAVATEEWALSLAYPVFTAKSWKMFRQICLDERISITFHNRQYDELVLARYGINIVGPVHDTMLKHHAAFPGASHKLQDVGTQFFAIRPWKAEFRRGTDEKGRPDTIENLLLYNARDTLVTKRLDPILDDCVAKTDSGRCYEVDNALAPIAREMEAVGIPIDRGRSAELKVHFEQIITRTLGEIEANANDPAIYEKFVDGLALIRAIGRRKHDPPDFLARHKMRFDELFNGVRRKKPAPGIWECPGCSSAGRDMELPEQCACGDVPSWTTEPKIFLKGKGPVKFKLSNPDHVAAYLKARGHRLYRVTKGGKPSTAKDVLEELTHIADVRTILEFREASKLLSTFVVGLPVEWDTRFKENITFVDTDDAGKMVIRAEPRWGRLHSSWDIHKITGRRGSSPNVQNWPKANMRGRPNLRTQVVAPPGRILVGADYAQLEARIIGMLSGDPFLVSIFMENYGDCEAGCKPTEEPVKFCPKHDIHTVFALEVFSGFLNYSKDERKELRDLVKRGEYGGFYGGAIETLYASIVKEFPDVSISDVAQIVQIINARMPLVDVWHQDLIRQAMSGEIRSAILGRRRTFPLGNADMSVVYNFPVQATAADIVDLGILSLVPQLPEDADLIIQGHDAVVIECYEEDAPDVANITTSALSQEFTVNGTKMFYPANAAIDKCWANV